MVEFIIIVGILSVVAFILHGAEKIRLLKKECGFPTLLMVVTGIFAPFGSLLGMLLFSNRVRQPVMIILVPGMLIAFVAGVYLLRVHLI